MIMIDTDNLIVPYTLHTLSLNKRLYIKSFVDEYLFFLILHLHGPGSASSLVYISPKCVFIGTKATE